MASTKGENAITFSEFSEFFFHALKFPVKSKFLIFYHLF